jgi:Ca2+-binding RTX toxin-like protein
VVDRVDDVSDNCGTVVHPRVRCRKLGTRGPDRVVGTRKRDVICGLGGGDTINGLEGNDAIDGGQGNDTVSGGPDRDRLFGGAGHDVLLARDGRTDTLDCGKDYDTALVDRFDRVARNCETVRRASRRRG